MRRNILIGLAGITIGTISAFSFEIAAFDLQLYVNYVIAFLLSFSSQFVPGFVFGLAVAIIYFKTSEEQLTRQLFLAGCVTIIGLICYQIAFRITVFITSAAITITSWAVLIAAPIGAAIGGFVATIIFISFLQYVTNKYSAVLFKFSLYGGLMGAILIDPIAYSMSSTPDDLSVLLLSSCVFFIGWQTVMLMIISDPLLKKRDDAVRY